MEVEFVKELPDWGKGDACLVRKGDAYFVVSSAHVPFSGFETLAFPANADGEIEDWLEAAGWRGATRQEVIEEIQNDPDLGFINVTTKKQLGTGNGE